MIDPVFVLAAGAVAGISAASLLRRMAAAVADASLAYDRLKLEAHEARGLRQRLELAEAEVRDLRSREVSILQAHREMLDRRNRIIDNASRDYQDLKDALEDALEVKVVAVRIREAKIMELEARTATLETQVALRNDTLAMLYKALDESKAEVARLKKPLGCIHRGQGEAMCPSCSQGIVTDRKESVYDTEQV